MEHTSTNEATKLIRAALRAGCKTLHVRHGTGTAYGWIEISGSADKSGTFTDAERAYLRKLGFTPGGNFCVISPDSEDRDYWLKVLCGIGCVA